VDFSSERLSVVIPAFNEARRLTGSLEKVLAYGKGPFGEIELIVVDDGSRDGTAESVRSLSIPYAEVCVHERNRGKGAAIRTGVAAASGTLILTSDADFSTPIEEVEVAAAALDKDTDVVIASREAPGTRIPSDQHPLRKNMGRIFNRCVRVMTGLPFADTQCGFKLFRRDAAKKIYERTVIDGFASDVEVLIVCRALGLGVREIPVTWINSPDSRVNILAHPWTMLRDLMRIRIREMCGGYLDGGRVERG
jgi:dolichyl-phosphate beta-glucosyltransferase